MSSTTLYAAYEDGELVVEHDFKNSHGSASFVWRTLCRKYKWQIERLLKIRLSQFEHEHTSFIWKYEDANGSLRAWEYNCLISTYDHVIVIRPDMLALAESMELFERAHSVREEVCSLTGQAEVIRQAHEKGARAIAWQQTSVAEDLWWVDTDDEGDGGRRLNIDIDEGWWIGHMITGTPGGWTGGEDAIHNRTEHKNKWSEPCEGWAP